MSAAEPGPRPRIRVQTPVGERTRTKQAPKEETDINVIMSRYTETGQAPIPNAAQGVYGDFSGVEDYQTSLNRVYAAQAAYDELPARVRDHTRNDPGDLVDLALNPERADEAQELGILPLDPKRPEPVVVPADVSPPAEVQPEPGPG